MKRLLVMLLTLAMVFALAVPAVADLDDDYDNQNVFSIEEKRETLHPGVDYYFDCKWQGGPMTDDFFEFYTVSVGASRYDDDEPSTTEAKKIAEVLEFARAENEDKYYLHFRARQSYNYPDDIVTILITVVARDNSRNSDREDSRSWEEFDLDIGYTNKNTVREVNSSRHDVDNEYCRLEFDDDLESCRLTFEDKSYYTAHLGSVKGYNVGMSTDANKLITDAYPNATLKFLTFYTRPQFAEKSVLKVYAPGCDYLYKISPNNELTLLANGNNDGYLGISTNVLDCYVASSVPLSTSAVGSGNFSNAASTGSAVQQAAVSGSVSGSANTQAGSPVISNPNTGAAV